jgi:hypothetical protein
VTQCSDPDCIGCITECYVKAMKAVGCDAQIIFDCVMDELRQTPEGGFEVELEGTVH